MEKAKNIEKKCHCPYCDDSVPETAPFCKGCGSKLRFCSECGCVIPRTAEKCHECGAEVKTSDAKKAE
jgi:hypothetical protein